MNLIATKSLERIKVNLVALGIGAGLFSPTGIAAAENAGRAVVLSFVVAAIGCAFAGMCYSEFSTSCARAL